MAGEQHEAFKQLSVDLVEVLVNVGLINSISERWPEEVQDNWTEKLEEMSVWANDQIREAQIFASGIE